MNSRPRAGLLPCYLKLYDDLMPDLRAGFDAFLEQIRIGLETRGVAVTVAPTARLAAEFAESVSMLEAQPVDCLVTVHLAYSPSLEAIESCCRCPLPLLLLDTTMDLDFGQTVGPDRIMYNHGVHGVMDLASVLRRRGRVFEIVAGHVGDGGMLDRAAARVRAAVAARQLRGARVLRVGPAFAGMGDFAVAEDVLETRFGIQVDEIGLAPLAAAANAVPEAAVAAELAADGRRYACELDATVHARSVKVGLGLRDLLEQGAYTAMSVNFQAFETPVPGADTMPFLEISKAMARGVGYAGEGDVLTAVLVGALTRAFGAVTFTEVFCPDWLGNTLFLSHMGELSPAVVGERPRVIEKTPYPFGPLTPAQLVGAIRTGPAVLVNLAPGPEDTFTLILVPVDVVAESIHSAMRDVIRGWIRPRRPLPEFLEAYSRVGGTHHNALVLGDALEALVAMARFAEIPHVILD